MRKHKNEINLTVGRDLDSAPFLKKNNSHNGGMNNSADNIIASRMAMIDKTKNYEK